MAFDYDTKYVKDTTIPYVDTLSRLRYITSESEKEEEKFEDIFLHWIETDILLIDKWAENISKWDPSILFRIKKKKKKKWTEHYDNQKKWILPHANQVRL